MDINESKVVELLKLDLNTLLEVIGEEDGALFATPTDKRKRGLRRVRNSISRIKEKICSNKFLKTYYGNDKDQRKVAAVAAIADLLGGCGAVTVSVLIVQVGIENICKDKWESGLG